MTSAARQVLLFQLGARVFAAQAPDVRRIAGSLLERPEDGVAETALGRPWDARRGLVVEVDGEERTVLVDAVLGLRLVPGQDFEALPAFAREVLPTTALAGFAMLDDVPTLVVDLTALVRERDRGAAPSEEENQHA